MTSAAQQVRQVINALAEEATLYRRIASNVVKISMKGAICFNKPVVVEGEVEVEDLFSGDHLVFVRPRTERAALVVPRFVDLRYSKVVFFDVYVYANGVWLNRPCLFVKAEGCDLPVKVVRELLGEEGGAARA
jgi:hypothetical protein